MKLVSDTSLKLYQDDAGLILTISNMSYATKKRERLLSLVSYITVIKLWTPDLTSGSLWRQ